jgi:ParB-like chromosome segregation protein Spo0J
MTREIDTLGLPYETKSPEAVSPPHGVRDEQKAERLASEFEQSGWEGPPLLVDEPEPGRTTAIDGSHRIAAARDSGMDEVPVLDVRDALADPAVDASPDEYITDSGVDEGALYMDEIDGFEKYSDELGRGGLFG